MTAFKLTIIFLAIISIGCTTTSPRSKILRDMAIGAVVGALIAQNKDKNKAAYTSMYVGVGGATTGAISAYFNAPDEDLKNENESLKIKLDSFQKKLDPQLIQKGTSLFSSPLPKEVSDLVEPGEWKRYKMDQWVQDPNQSNTWYRQVEMFEIIPPVTK